MSKSLGNIITIREGLEKYGSDGLRVFVLTSHYRAPLSYSEEALESGKRAAERLRWPRLSPAATARPPTFLSKPIAIASSRRWTTT